MNVLIADDDATSRFMLQSLLTAWGYSVIPACDGNEAWKILCEPDAPQLVILDWMMPGLEGPEIVQRLRSRTSEIPCYAIIITSRSVKDSAAMALNAGADDFIGKPFDAAELKARVAVGWRINCLQRALSDRIEELRQSLSRVKQLEGIIPICSYCKKIRDDQNDWNQLEQYISDHSEAKFSHGICPLCVEKQMEIIKNMDHTTS
jgi:phosphoserine phosphatase RsbU/P